MPDSLSIVCIGASGHAKVIIDILEMMGLHIAYLQDKRPPADFLFGYKVVTEIPGNAAHSYLICIGNNAIRKKLSLGFQDFATAIHPGAIVSKHSSVGPGTVVMAGATINPATTIGRHCIVNTNSSVDHDCVLEDFVHISPNATLCGGVHVGEGTHIGAGAVVIPGVRIGRWCTVGAGAVVIKNLEDGCTAVGNPAKVIKQQQLQDV